MRRRALLGLAAAAASLRPRPVRAAPRFTMQEVVPGLYARRGVDQDATEANQDEIANTGFVVGDASVAVIDPGGSLADGQQLRTHLRAATDKPISHVIMTHFHPDHVFGAVAFADDKPHFVANARMLPMLVSRGEYYRNRLADIVGIDAAGDYEKPDLLVTDALTIDLGGRPLHLRSWPTAHTDNDLTALDEKTATLWTGDLLFLDRIPSLDGSIIGWLADIKALREVPAARAIPGHGPFPAPWPAALLPEEHYLSLIARDVRAMIARGGSIEEAVASVGQSERGKWKLFDDYNGRNVTAAFTELEWE